MTDFIYFYRIGIEERRRAMAPGARSESMQAWLTWMRDLEARGHLKSPGQPLEDSGKVVRGQAMTLTDGPFVEVKDLVSGYSIVQAASLEEAAELSRGCPILKNGGSVEIRPVMAMSA